MVPGHKGNLPLAENFYKVPSIWSRHHKLSNETCLQWKKIFVPYGPIIGLFRLTYTPVYMVSHWADHLRPPAPDLLQCGSIDIEYLPLSHFLMWSSTGGWLTSTRVRWACLLTEFSSWAVQVGWAIVFWFSCWAVVWSGWPSWARDQRLFGVPSLYQVDAGRCW